MLKATPNSKNCQKSHFCDDVRMLHDESLKKKKVYYCPCGCYRYHTRGLTTLIYIYNEAEEVVDLCSSVSLTAVAVVTMDLSVLLVCLQFYFDLYREKLLESVRSYVLFFCFFLNNGPNDDDFFFFWGVFFLPYLLHC